MYEKSAMWEEILSLASEIGDRRRYLKALAVLSEKKGDLKSAGKAYVELKEWEKALLLFQMVESWEDLAELKEKMGDYKESARLYEKAGNLSNARELYEKGEEWEDLARVLEEEKNFSESAQVYRRLKKWRKASELMEKEGNLRAAISDLQVALREEGWDLPLARRLVDLLLKAGMANSALPLLERLVPSVPTNPDDAELLYRYAMVLEGEGKGESAMKVYERIVAYDLMFRDVRERLERRKKEVLEGGSSTVPLPVSGTTRKGGESSPWGGRYEVVEEIGKGGMGVVYKARDSLLERWVALKVVRMEEVTQGSRDRLLKEARVSASLNHPHIVQVYDCAFVDDFLLIAMEYVEGKTLKEVIGLSGPLPIPMAILLIGQVAKALAYAHEQGIVHRDVKPANILWTGKKVAKLTDFGIARFQEELRTTRTLVVGTPLYMAPEQIMGKPVDHRADLYSLGVTFYEALTGTPPFPHGDVGYHHIHTPPPPPQTHRPDLPPSLPTVVLKLLEKDPERRYPSARAFLTDLKKVLTEGGERI